MQLPQRCLNFHEFHDSPSFFTCQILISYESRVYIHGMRHCPVLGPLLAPKYWFLPISTLLGSPRAGNRPEHKDSQGISQLIFMYFMNPDRFSQNPWYIWISYSAFILHNVPVHIVCIYTERVCIRNAHFFCVWGRFGTGKYDFYIFGEIHLFNHRCSATLLECKYYKGIPNSFPQLFHTLQWNSGNSIFS